MSSKSPPDIADVIARYRRAERRGRGAPRLSAIIADLAKVSDDAERLTTTLASLGRWTADALDPAGLVPGPDAHRLAHDANITDALEGALEDRLKALAELARFQADAVRRAVPDYSRGGARDATALLGPPPRWALVNELAEIWLAEGEPVTGTPTGAFAEHVHETFARAGITTAGLDHIIRQVAARRNAAEFEAFSHGQAA